MTASAQVMQELRRVHDGDIKLSGMLTYNTGILVMFQVADENHVTHRVAFFQHISINTDNDTLHKKWDSIC